jgi:uncharacterized protein (TIGR04255 family)
MKNSIESATFILALERPFNEQELQCLLRLESALKEELPFFTPINTLSVKVEGGQVTQSQEMIGVLLQHFKSDGKPSIVLKVERNVIQVTHFLYDHWAIVWQKVKLFILEIIKSVDSDNRLSIYILKVVDKFLCDNEDHKVLDIFSENTPYLTQNIICGQSKGSWHIFQGWFDQYDNNSLLNNLNINTTTESSNNFINIEHDIRYQFDSPQEIFDIKDQQLDDIFSVLHEKNKTVVKSLLNDTKLKEIGLCK